jgi:hypothetical protein
MVSPFQVEVNSQYHDAANLIPEERALGTHRIGAWVGPRVYLGAVAKTKISSSYWEPNLGRPVHSQSRYWLSYSSWLLFLIKHIINN